MPTDRKPSLILPVAVTLAVVLGLYVGAYYWRARRSRFPVRVGETFFAIPAYSGKLLDPPPVRLFFRPLHWLDRRIRPHFWKMTVAEIIREHRRE